MHTWNELDLIRHRNEDLRREAENNHLARQLRLAGANKASRPLLLARVRVALRPTPNEVSVENCEG